MKLIPLYGGMVAQVDDDMFEELSKFRWHVTGRGYAARNNYTKGRKGSSGTVFMHRVVNRTPADMQTDHINGDKLDNRRSNLRTCTNAENCRTIRRKGSTGFRGVCRRKDKWLASIMHNGKRQHLGSFDTAQEAAAAYRGAATVLYGEFQPLDLVA